MMYKGFEYLGKVYIWKNKELFRLPYNIEFRYFGVLKCAKWNDKGFYLGSHRKSFKQLESITKDIESSFVFQSNKDTPF